MTTSNATAIKQDQRFVRVIVKNTFITFECNAGATPEGTASPMATRTAQRSRAFTSDTTFRSEDSYGSATKTKARPALFTLTYNTSEGGSPEPECEPTDSTNTIGSWRSSCEKRSPDTTAASSPLDTPPPRSPELVSATALESLTPPPLSRIQQQQQQQLAEIQSSSLGVQQQDGQQPAFFSSMQQIVSEAMLESSSDVTAEDANCVGPGQDCFTTGLQQTQEEGPVYFDPSSGSYFRMIPCSNPFFSSGQEQEQQQLEEQKQQQPEQQQPWHMMMDPTQQQWQRQPQPEQQLQWSQQLSRAQQAAANRRQQETQAQQQLRQMQQRKQQTAPAVAAAEDRDTKCTTPENLRTTVMIRNIPNQYSRVQLEQTLDDEGYWGLFDFLYLPMDFVHQANVGYAFVNFMEPEVAARFMVEFRGFDRWAVSTLKVADVCWSLPHQGLEAHIERYRNSPVMHPTMPDHFRPRVYASGRALPFPPPTKVLRPPKIRPTRKPVVGCDFVTQENSA